MVGGGISGLHLLLRLLEAGISPDRIGLFEAEQRLGGRIKTVFAPEAPALPLDMGARIFREKDQLVSALVERFGIATVPFVNRQDNNLLHFRGRTRTARKMRKARLRRPFPYDISTRMQRRGAGGLFRELRQRVHARTQPGGKAAGRPPDELPFDALIREVMKPDEIAFLEALSGYSFWSAPLHPSETIDWAAREVFGRMPAFQCPDGMGRLCRELSAESARIGGRIETGQRLACVSLPEMNYGNFKLTFRTQAGDRQLTAARLVLAMPKQAVSKIGGLANRAEISELLDAVTGWRILTADLIYATNWWTSFGFSIGRTLTDLPARQISYLGAEDWRPRTGGPGALHFYCDGKAAEFWAHLAGPADAGWRGADHPLTKEMHRQMQTIFGAGRSRAIPEPLASNIQDWADDPFGGALHLWTFGGDPAKARLSALDPIPGMALHICGEAWSNSQGWMEGALQTAEALFERCSSRPA